MVALLAAACAGPSPGPRVQAVLDQYAPYLTLGERVSNEPRTHYHLHVAPYSGYRDSLDQTTDGLRDLAINVDVYVDDSDTHRWRDLWSR